MARRARLRPPQLNWTCTRVVLSNRCSVVAQLLASIMPSAWQVLANDCKNLFTIILRQLAVPGTHVQLNQDASRTAKLAPAKLSCDLTCIEPETADNDENP